MINTIRIFLTLCLLVTLCFLVDACASSIEREWQRCKHLVTEDFTTRSGLNEKSCPNISNLAMWIEIQRSPHKFTFGQIAHFINTHRHWPSQTLLCKQIESVIDENTPSNEILSWFTSHKPLTAMGANAYIQALLEHGNMHKAKIVLKQTWRELKLSAAQEKEFLKNYGRFLSREDHQKRLDKLLWDEERDGAKRLLSYVGPRDRKVANIIIELMEGRNTDDVKALLKFSNEVLLYNLAKWYRQNKDYLSAFQILLKVPFGSKHAKAWWRERNYIARELIADKQYDKAYKVIKIHSLTKGEEYATAEWLAGWLCLTFLSKPQTALAHFKRLYLNVKSPISVARACYWAGRTEEALKNKIASRNWYLKALPFKSTYYGQLSAAKLNHKTYPFLKDYQDHSPKAHLPFSNNDLVKAAHLLSYIGKPGKTYLRLFLCHMASQAKSLAEKEFTVALAHKLSPSNVVWAARKAATHNNIFLKIAYPLVKLPYTAFQNIEKALVMAIIYQESRFDPSEVSSAGAMGLMQLHPVTAKEEAKRLQLKHSDNKLFNVHHNITIGTHHLARIVEKYKGCYAIALAAYNAGEAPVDRWLQQFGDPRQSAVSLTDWIELIPYHETRNYVQRVLETLAVYRKHIKSNNQWAAND